MNKYLLIVIAAAVGALGAGGAQAIWRFTDTRDGKTYRTVKIDKMVWMAENLNFAAKGSVCYENKNANCAKYGRLYNWDTALKACPDGWSLPSDDEWAALENYAGGVKKAGTKLKSKAGWNNNGNGTDQYGFAALPGGGGSSGGGFGYVGIFGLWWSTTEDSANHARSRYMYYDGEHVGWDVYNKTYRLSVRCVAD